MEGLTQWAAGTAVIQSLTNGTIKTKKAAKLMAALINTGYS